MKKSQLKSLIEEIVKQSLLFETIQDPTKEEMLNYLQSLYGQEEGFVDDAEVAMYWFANSYHGGQSSNLYSVLSNSRFNPGPIAKGPEPHSSEEMMYEDLVVKFFPTSKEGQELKRKHNALNEAISPKNQALIEKWMKTEGARKTAYKMVNSIVSQRTGMDIRDMADTATLASGLDTIEAALNSGNFEGALKLTYEAAKEFFDEEAGEGIFEIGNLKETENKKNICQKCKGEGHYTTTLKDRSGRNPHGLGTTHIVPCDFPGCHGGIVDSEENRRAQGLIPHGPGCGCNLKETSQYDPTSTDRYRMVVYYIAKKLESYGYMPLKGIEGFDTADKIILAKDLPMVKGIKGNKEYIFLELTRKYLIASIAKHLLKHRKTITFDKRDITDINKIVEKILSYSQAKKHEPPVISPLREAAFKPDQSFFSTLDKALEAVELYLDKNKAVVDDNEHPKDEKIDRHGIRKPFMFGGIVYEKSREAHYKLLTLNGNFTKKYLHIIIYRMPQGSYELTRYIA